MRGLEYLVLDVDKPVNVPDAAAASVMCGLILAVRDGSNNYAAVLRNAMLDHRIGLDIAEELADNSLDALEQSGVLTHLYGTKQVLNRAECSFRRGQVLLTLEWV